MPVSVSVSASVYVCGIWFYIYVFGRIVVKSHIFGVTTRQLIFTRVSGADFLKFSLKNLQNMYILQISTFLRVSCRRGPAFVRTPCAHARDLRGIPRDAVGHRGTSLLRDTAVHHGTPRDTSRGTLRDTARQGLSISGAKYSLLTSRLDHRLRAAVPAAAPQ